MYGYVVPLKQKLEINDFGLYRAFYCGLCKCTGKMFGQLPRLTTNYDMVFLSVLCYDVLEAEAKFANERCILNPFKKKTVVLKDELLSSLADVNMILAYHKASDDVIDEGAKKKMARLMLKKAYRKAAARFPLADEAVRKGYEQLRTLEQANESGVDRVAHCFAGLLMQLGKLIMGERANDSVLNLCYNVGKFVYLIDALDDVDEDYKKRRYNPFLADGKAFGSRKDFFEHNESELRFALNSTVNRAIESFNQFKCSGAYNLLSNIVYYGLRDKVDEVFASKKKLPAPRI